MNSSIAAAALAGALASACSAPPDEVGIAVPDAGNSDANLQPQQLPALLSLTGLFASLPDGELSEQVEPYVPIYELWSDGLTKRRWLMIPAGQQIDTSVPGDWRFPVGTRLFKEFATTDRALETRVLWKVEADRWVMGAYLWRADGSDAELVAGGANDVLGTTHDVPGQGACRECHQGEADTALGLSAVQLAHSGTGVTVSNLTDRDLLSHPPDQIQALRLSGADAPALGYLHANCGHCHNPRGAAWDRTELLLRVGLSGQQPQTDPIYQSIQRRLAHWTDAGFSYPVVAGSPSSSALLHRMLQRGDADAMPPIATERVDQTGTMVIEAWIAAMSAD